ncbi:hypothetical protein ABH926_003809 [Catenulispora sp. GP43]|uniref:preATP grasp domain-containing protein n=1 Tax=Catenulispora sp. GP43 TaxID=3156263 RepID=UPI003517BADA
MSQLIIGNQLTEETAEGEGALPSEYRRFLSVISHRMVWFAQDGDVLVLPSRPGEGFLAYVRRVNGLAEGEPLIVVPQPGRQGAELLYDDRLAAPEFVAGLRTLIAERGVDRVFPFHLGAAVLRLARETGLDGPFGGVAFLAERGGELVNSKAAFRAVAAGNAVPIPDGKVCVEPAEAEEFAWPLLAGGQSVIVKQDLHGGGYGNELLVPAEGVTGVGATNTVVVPDRAALAAHLVRSWPRYSYGGSRPVVVEHYIHDCGQLYIEFRVTAEAVSVLDYGQVRMEPIMHGLVLPPPPEEVPDLAEFVAGATRVAQALRAVGYRGYAGLDAIVTPAGRVLFNEVNGRVAGSTHLDALARRAVGEDYLTARVLISRNRVPWPSFTEAEALLDKHGLAFDPDERTGILLPGDDDAPDGPTGQFLVVGRDHGHAGELERRALAAFGLDGGPDGALNGALNGAPDGAPNETEV